MNRKGVSLREAEGVEIVTLMDNYVDVLIQGSEVVTRPPLSKTGEIPTDTVLAEHGLSMLVTVWTGEDRHTVLFDAGYSRIGVPHNMEMLGVDTGRIEAIALSHGHMDHTGSLYEVLERIPRRVPLAVHPEAFTSPRYFGLADGRKIRFPQTLVREDLEKHNVDILESKDPTLLADGLIAVTGQVDRVTPFEKGLPNATLERDGKVEDDPIADDQSLVIKLKGKGLVVVSGCAHAGIINTVYAGKEIAGTETVHAILGGFHLSGPFFEQIIEETIGELKKMEPRVLVPMHCTGWKAIQRFSEEFPDAFILNSVGSTFTLA